MRPRLLRRIQHALALIGVACLGWYAGVYAEMWRYQAREQAALEQALVSPPLAPTEEAPETAAAAAPTTEPEESVAIGRIEISRVRLSAIVAEGTGARTLRVAVGHVSDTPMPWESGNSAIAGHRDTFFRPLERVAIGDDIRIVTRRGAFRYVVREILIVDPDEVWVLSPTTVPQLTLVTCYPFDAIGPAPQRYVVRADRFAAVAVPTAAHR